MANKPSIVSYKAEERLHEAIASFEQAVDANLNPDPGAWLARYPDVADRLRKYFANQAGIKRLAEPLLPPSPVSGLPRPFGAYELLEEIGRGGMGVVYKARQVGLNRLVAVKMILGGSHVREDALGRFRVEGKAIARLHHPNVVQIYEVGDLNGCPYFSLEFVDGSSLARKLAGEPQAPRYAAAVVQAIARGIQASHDRGIVHRDLKPHNVLLTAAGTPKVTDFGLAKQLDDDLCQTRTGAVMGTPPYMAPEQAAGRTKEIGPSTDVYGLGAILYELLTGRPPFRGTSVSETLEQVMKNEAVPPRRLQPKVPRDLETICLKCLQKEPKQRYLTAGALADDLRRFLAGEPIQARPVGQGERLWRWCRRNPALAAALTVAAALLVSGTAVSGYFAVNEAAQAESARKEKEDAVAARDALKKANAKLRSERDKSEIALVRSLVRPFMAQRPQGQIGWDVALTAPENEAFWELAEQPAERVRHRFISVALQDPLFTRQLRNRARLAVHAAVGLDVRQREVVEGLLLKRLQQEVVSEKQRTDIALIAASLGNLSPQKAAAVGQALIQAMSKTNDDVALHELIEGLLEVAAHLEPKDAAIDLTQAMTKTTNHDDLRRLAQWLSAVSVCLEPKDAAQAANTIIQAMSKAHPFAQPHLAEGLSAVAARLQPKDAARAANALCQAMTNRNNLASTGKLAQGLSAVAARLEPKDAAQVANVLTQAMSKAPPIHPPRGPERAGAGAVGGGRTPGAQRRFPGGQHPHPGRE
jgi:serine/threonine protein kinase